jgi:integrase
MSPSVGVAFHLVSGCLLTALDIGEICAIPFKKCTKTPVTYLEKAEIDALLAAPNLQTVQGRRHHLLLLFLYNTGARADEAAQVLIGDEGVSLVVGGEQRLNSFYATCFFNEV